MDYLHPPQPSPLKGEGAKGRGFFLAIAQIFSHRLFLFVGPPRALPS